MKFTTVTSDQPARTRTMLVVMERDNYQWAHLDARIVGRVITTSMDGDDALGVGWTSFEPPFTVKSKFSDADLDGLVVSCQMRTGEEPDSALAQPYGWHVRYHDVYSVDFPRAESMVRTLRAIEKQRLAIDEQEGYPATFGHYIARACRILGCTHVRINCGRMLPNGRCFRFVRPGVAIGMIDDIARQFIEGEEIRVTA